MYKSVIKNLTKFYRLAEDGYKECIKAYGLAQTYYRWEETAN